MLISIVIPCYYSEKTIRKVVELTKTELEKAGYETEFILVNDGSTDGTFDEIKSLCSEYQNIVGINCAKNLGQHSAIMAGLARAIGELILVMDDDMQTHPSQSLKLVNSIINSDYDVVYASWKSHKESFIRRMGSNFTVWSMRVLTNRPKNVYPSNFFIIRSFVRDEIVRYTGPYVYIQGLLFRSTVNMGNVEVDHFEREQGSSGYTLKTLIRLWLNVLGFSVKPLRVATVVGAIMGLFGLIAAFVLLIHRLIDPSIQAGWSSIMITILLCSGLIILFLGIIGEYLGRLFMTANNSPQFVIKEVIDNRKEVRS